MEPRVRSARLDINVNKGTEREKAKRKETNVRRTRTSLAYRIEKHIQVSIFKGTDTAAGFFFFARSRSRLLPRFDERSLVSSKQSTAVFWSIYLIFCAVVFQFRSFFFLSLPSDKSMCLMRSYSRVRQSWQSISKLYRVNRWPRDAKREILIWSRARCEIMSFNRKLT